MSNIQSVGIIFIICYFLIGVFLLFLIFGEAREDISIEEQRRRIRFALFYPICIIVYLIIVTVATVISKIIDGAIFVRNNCLIKKKME